MTMPAKGLAKLIEECGELQQVAGKKLAYWTTEEHPDGGPPLNERLADEIADVVAACWFVAKEHRLDQERIDRRIVEKARRFEAWGIDPSNAPDRIDATRTP